MAAESYPPSPSLPAGSLHCPNCGAAIDEHAPKCPYCQARLATMACPSCFKRMFLGAAFCSHCGVKTSREEGRELDGAPCPRCRKAMHAVQVGSLSLVECAECGGVWVGAPAFAALCRDQEAQAAVLHGTLHGQTSPSAPMDTRVQYRKCPRCQTMMNRVNFASRSGVVLDVCRQHGTFFDRDELHRVVTFIQSGGLDRARAREREALREEQRRLESLQRMPYAGRGRDFGADSFSGGSTSNLGLDLTAASLFELFLGSLDF